MKNTTHKKVTKGTIFIANAETGEAITLGTADIRTTDQSADKDFYKLFIKKTQTGIFELDLILYLIKRMENSNTIFITDDKIAKDFKTTRQRVARAKKKLKEADILKYIAGGIFLNPEYIYRGTAYKRQKRIDEYFYMKGL